tara:strand:- start:5789 stop:6598 length:810 start_codon:yes stop_codon:yes gene_type:complete
MENIGGIYVIRNLTNNKIYVGSTKNFEERWKQHQQHLMAQKHCNIILQRAFNKRGKDNFIFEIIEECTGYTRKSLFALEDKYIESFKAKNRDFGYNIADAGGGDILSTHPNKADIIARMSTTLKENAKNLTESERIEKWGQQGESNGMFGRTHTVEARKRISDFHKGNSYAKGSVRTEEQRQRLSEFAKTRTGDKNGFYGKTHSDETKKKLSESMKGKKPPNMRAVVIDGIKYESLNEASRQLGIHVTTILWRVNSPNKKFESYSFFSE